MNGAGTISGRWALAAGRAGVKGCRICHGPTLPGTRLCTQCKAALKRARQETVSEVVPPLSRSSVAAKPQRASRPAVVAPERKHSAALILKGTALVLLSIAAVAVGFGVLHFARSTPAFHSDPHAAEVAPPRVEPPLPAPVVESVPAAPPIVTTPAHPAPRKAAERPAPKVAEPLPPPPPTIARFATATEPPAPQPTPPEPVVTRPAPPPDRWQLMSESIAQQCGREGFFSGVICEQRVRIKFCEGYWGQVPQCPSGIPNDHGQ